MDSKNIDIAVGGFLCFLSIAIYLYAERYAGAGVNQYGPNFFPQILAVMLFIASVVCIVQALRGHALKDLETIDKPGLIRAAVMLLIAIAYILLMQVVGFFIATVVFLYAQMTYLKQKSLLVRVITSVLVAMAVYALFHSFLKIPLPEGVF
ncbi:tripartite tricarboxylate transporter TctB family protein [Granulosicoccaceae sp. 1_MG-2023]|nr:tripartite tricarboxylate transporter TctB family protein [Granulosicoccaceae sp. 1_MG-2023]